MIESTFGLLKPDAVDRNLDQIIFSKILKCNLIIDNKKKLTLTKFDVEYIYGHNLGQSFWNDYVNYMTCGPIVGFIVNGESAISNLNNLVGYYIPNLAKEGTIRKELGIHDYFKKYKCFQNIIHSSVNQEKAEYELRWFNEKSR
ncbi:MAG: nucleoside-diphosphate kinase [Candidatus Nanoarchaeia archaeon]|nr:nucleoside-diphosphate kinase [Candidatus Nanoarchaeia archaeon]MDD5054479.1 nucleoside-diphosphate kinase [Candidatus Nanoarchaeia archaeon]MDD5499615.1 nucleoside-diphosphate kinase [Candidatus Nanoarchaeia archaeon]